MLTRDMNKFECLKIYLSRSRRYRKRLTLKADRESQIKKFFPGEGTPQETNSLLIEIKLIT